MLEALLYGVFLQRASYLLGLALGRAIVASRLGLVLGLALKRRRGSFVVFVDGRREEIEVVGV